jgi:histidine triad (HIT) family protein
VENCIFCRIVEGTAPTSLIHADEKIMAFMDTQPVNPGHTLIIPKTHVAQLSELDEETGGHIFKVAMQISDALRHSGLKCEGVNMFLADGEAASQDVFHVHLHVIPRFRGDGFGIRFGPNYGSKPDRKELDNTAGKIRKAIRLNAKR